ncbi:LicD family protein [Methanobrevibacter sp.]|uniref:LicD family protein n=1 Tax=Methanobrevibacter sp. TaxID=66852 RepID=UPI0025DCDBEA|nr:LicD family protein [Methanobrevibacter sp.]MBR4448493.1 LicD family protein [Methanobrevibacter sp.]
MILDKLKKDKNEEIISDEDYVSRKEFNKLKRRINAHQYYLNNIYVFYSLEPTQFLKEIKDLSYGMMEFLGHLCDKHDLTYWLDSDTLLNVARHGEFMPENLDLNMGMLKSDLMKFVEVFKSEMNNTFSDNVAYEFKESPEFFKITFKFNDLEDLLLEVNVFPYDYLDDESMVKDSEDKPFKADILFPLGKMQLDDYSYPVPCDVYEYLKHRNDDFMFSLSRVPDFDRLNRLRKQPDLFEMLKRYNAMFRSANENF